MNKTQACKATLYGALAALIFLAGVIVGGVMQWPTV